MDGSYSETMIHDGRKYTLCPYDGGSHFRGVKGDLNSNAGGHDLHLFYTREESSDIMAVHKLSVDTNRVGSVSNIDMNRGCDRSEDLFLHAWMLDNNGRTYIDDVPSWGWMSYIPDNIRITDLSIPGTHDSGSTWLHVVAGEDKGKTQTYHIGRNVWTDVHTFGKDEIRTDEGLMYYGIRYMDIRYGLNSDSSSSASSHLQLVHNGYYCQYFYENGRIFNTYNKTTNDHFMGWVKEFLDENPSETVILDIADDDSDNKSKTQEYAYNFYKSLAASPDPQHPEIYIGDHVPTMGEVRGKLVILSDLGGDKDYSIKQGGKTLYWAFANGYAEADKNMGYALAATGKAQEYRVYKDNLWNEPSISQKWEYVQTGFRNVSSVRSESEQADYHPFMLNYTSANEFAIIGGTTPKEYAEVINPNILSYLRAHTGDYFGIVAMDFAGCLTFDETFTSLPSTELLARLIRTNFKGAIPGYGEGATISFKDTGTPAASNMPADMKIRPQQTDSVRIPDTVPLKSGQTFTGWNTKADGSGTRYAPGAALSVKGDLILYAQWQVIFPEYWYIVYHANGGSDVPQTQVFPEGKDAVLSDAIPVHDGFFFLGWADSPDAKTAQYRPGDTVKYQEGKTNLSLYALWVLNPVERPVLILFDNNGLESARLPDDISVPKNTPYTLAPAIAPLGGKVVYGGWSTDPAAVAPEYKAGTSYTFARDTILYAFRGWAATPQSARVEYLPGQTVYFYISRRTINLYAVWALDPVERPVIVTMDAGGLPGTVLPLNMSIPKNTWFRLEEAYPPEGSVRFFRGWSKNPDADVPDYLAGDITYVSEDTTFYAVWSKEYKVIYGAGSVWRLDSGVSDRFIANGELEDFVGLRVDGQLLDAADVVLSSGSTVADITAKKMQTLSVGEHDIRFDYSDGFASANFFVAKPTPKTGDRANPLLWFLLVLACAGAAAVLVKKRKSRHSGE